MPALGRTRALAGNRQRAGPARLNQRRNAVGERRQVTRPTARLPYRLEWNVADPGARKDHARTAAPPWAVLRRVP